MRAVVQRVSRAAVRVDGLVTGSIGRGILLLLGIGHDDTLADAELILKKTLELRIFNDPMGKMNLSIQDVGGELLVVSQFTLHGDCRKGRRPSYSDAMEPAAAERLYNEFVRLARLGPVPVATGEFQADMDVELVNDGPVTLLLDSRKVF
ncbi:MAG TPA: D-aminoacyl-tRNA deacylase [Acidobacteriota bacterium]|nr:D-tyrosyl-tRNA(Tyr) deacylase [Acidobacteriota bacterium]HOT02163.1 D-aminoacyl-tRNA deacylase [Acidobacteriota bacterium]HQF87115.1 D-aminoacyl-tRNA deacylase [Acidobacteriota bacterium]HQG91676.1 D-aminoacyl-tRNA deacylase [Acidobacteriota bacterium]HQK88512.1 D-aminoacyl-tRNA deacylase [Acidobacteriota bacterium]